MSGGAFFGGNGSFGLTGPTGTSRLTLNGAPTTPANTFNALNGIPLTSATGVPAPSDDGNGNVTLDTIEVTAPTSSLAGQSFNADGSLTLPPTDSFVDLGGSGSGGSANIIPSLGAAAGSGSGDGSGLSSLFGSGSGLGDLGGGGGSGGSGVAGNGGFIDNPLNGYRQVAYHFKLYCKGDAGSGTQVIIAETGKTGFNIREVHIDSIVAPNQHTINTHMTNFQIVVTEPTGVAFLDALYVAAAASGVKHNWNTCPYFLELSFKGYNENGSIADPITAGMPNGGKLTWQLNLDKINTTLETAGAVYTINAIMFHDGVLAPEWGSTQSNFSISGKTVQEYCDALTTAVNKRIVQDYKEQIVTYKFQFHGGGQSSGPNPSSFKIKRPSDNGIDAMRLLGMDTAKKEIRNSMIVRGSQFTQFIEELIGASEEGHCLAMLGKTSGDVKKIPTDGKFYETVHYRVYPEVKYTGNYNETYGQYIRTVTFHVKPYKTQTTFRSAQEVKAAGSQGWDAVKPRARKAYQYIFTGQNTEVINFDIKFDMVWSASLPRFAGWEQSNEMVEHHGFWDKKGTEALKAYKQGQANALAGAAQASAGQSTVGLGNLLSTGNLSALGSSTFQNAITNTIGASLSGTNSLFGGSSSASPAQSAAQQALGAFTSNGGSSGSGGSTVVNSGLNQIAQGNILASASEAALKSQAAAAYAQQIAGGATQASDGAFAEDLLASGTNGALPYVPITLSQAASAPTRAAGVGHLGQRGSVGRSVYGAMLDQLYDPTTYQEIVLSVRGDPFWLGGQYENMFQDTANDQNSADYSQGDTAFALVFRYPYGINESTGQPSFRPQNTYDGAYRATMVKHSFADGKFTQDITALRLAKVSPDAVNSAVAQSSTGSATAASSAGIPSLVSSTGIATPTTSSGVGTNTSSVLQVPSGNTATA